MKNIFLDFCLVLLIIFIGQQIFNPITIKNQAIEQQLVSFNEDIKKEKMADKYYLAKEIKPNKTSEMIESISDISRESVRVVVDAIANIFCQVPQ